MTKNINKRKFSILNTCLLSSFLLLSSATFAGETTKDGTKTITSRVKSVETKLNDLPKIASASGFEQGTARPFFGTSNYQALYAGGANFVNDKKVAYDVILRYDSSIKQWVEAGKLPQALAEGGCVTTEAGVFCIGGMTNNGTNSNAAFLMRWNGKTQKVDIINLPKLPVTIKMPAVAVWNNTVFVIAGEQNGKASNKVWKLDLKSSSADKKETVMDKVLQILKLKKAVKAGSAAKWEQIADLPGVARTQPIAAVQNTDQKKVALFVFGGTGIAEGDSYEKALIDGYQYTLGEGTQNWQPVASLVAPKLEEVKKYTAKVFLAPSKPMIDHIYGKDQEFSVIGAHAITTGNQHILVYGGFNIDVWNNTNKTLSTMDKVAKDAFLVEYFARDPKKFNWNSNVMAYHTVTNTWIPYCQLDIAPRCGAAFISLPKNKVLIAGGEIKPKMRTPMCEMVEIGTPSYFHWINWAVIAIYFIAVAWMGFWFMNRNKNADDYFKGGGNIPWWAVGMSIFATMLSSITFISIPTMTYISDWRYFPMVSGIFLMAPIVIRYYLPFFRSLEVTSAYEYLEKRFNLASRLFASLAFNVFMICRVAVVALLPSLAMSAVTGMDVKLCILIIGIITIVYCAIGGIEAVIWSDFVQGIILIGGAVMVLVMLINGTEGGVSGFWETSKNAGKLRLWDFRLLFNQPVFWVVMIQGIVGNLASYTSDQCVVQRYLTTKDEKSAANSIWFNGIMSVFASVLFYLLGTALYTYYKSTPQLLDVTMPKGDSIFPIYMVNELPIGVCGLLIAAIFAATMSTLSSNLNSSATSLTSDFIVRFKPDTSSKKQMIYGQVFTIAVGVLGTLAALILSTLPNHSLFDQFQKFIAMLTSGLACLFFMGIFTTRISGRGALIGLVANYIVCYWLDLSVVGWKPHPFVYGGIGMIVCFIVAYIVSIITSKDSNDLKGLTIYTIKKKKD